MSDEWVTPDDLAGAPLVPLPADPEGFVVVTLHDFAAVFEPGVDALLGSGEQVVIPAGGDAMVYGTGGVGKTTLAVDLAFHLAAGDDWLGIPVVEPRSVLLVESEGPRPLFRSKLRRKTSSWSGSSLGERLHVLEAPWGELSFASSEHRDWLARVTRRHAIDLIIAGPLTSLGMDDAGTLQEVRAFASLVDDVRSHAERPVTFLLVHHENKGGRVSGAWEGVGDALLHVQSSGHGRARLFMQKTRWASEWHARTLHLTWSDGDAFAIDETTEESKLERAWDAIERYVREHPGCSWRDARTVCKGIVGVERAQERRDAMLEVGLLVNVNTAGKYELWHRDDPARPQRFDDGSEERTAELEMVREPEPFPEPPGSSASSGNHRGTRFGGSGDVVPEPGDATHSTPPDGWDW